jgi:hypothetical protein
MVKPIRVTTNKRSYTVLPVEKGKPLPQIEWLPGEKVVEIVAVDGPETK